jgi:hypothetical protein
MHSLRSEVAAWVGQSVPLSFEVAVQADMYDGDFDDAVISVGVPTGGLNIDDCETLHPAEPLFDLTWSATFCAFRPNELDITDQRGY